MKIKELLNSPEKWTKGSYARTSTGNKISTYSPLACSWCLGGAIIYCYSAQIKFARVHHQIAAEFGNGFTVTVWNDHPDRTFEDIRKLVEKLDI